ncbi:MAG: hypothetical protein GYA18_06945 [Chloroflexi bacterium]|nr:hypothetical protein [Chloroflexota bacterium]
MPAFRKSSLKKSTLFIQSLREIVEDTLPRLRCAGWFNSMVMRWLPFQALLLLDRHVEIR